jgi:uncharacterized membrane protein YfcA
MLTDVLGALLVFAGTIGLTGYVDRMRFGRKASWIAGVVSGGFGGLVGNQGGIRSAAMLGLDIKGPAFVATATAIGLAVDTARVPVYLATGYQQIASAWLAIVACVAGVVAGTLTGERVLRRIPERMFRRIVSGILFGVGVFLLAHLHFE